MSAMDGKGHKVVTSSRSRNISEETFKSVNTLFSSSVKTAGDDIFDEKVQWDFLKFCFGFSMSCTMTVLAVFYSPILTTRKIGGIGSGVFYLSFALCSVGSAKYAVSSIGAKSAILTGHFGCFTYVVAFLLIAEYLEQNSLFYSNVVVAILGGASQAVMWAGLGKYTLKLSNLLISSMEITVVREMNRRLINDFARVYLVNLIFGFMLALILIYVKMFLDKTLLFFTLPVLLTYTVFSSTLLFQIDNLNDNGATHEQLQLAAKGLFDLVRSVTDMQKVSRRKLFCLLPYHVSWGINTAFWILYLVRDMFYDEISFLSAGYALLLSHLFSLLYTYGVKWICPGVNHNFHILIGGICSFCLGIACLSVDGFTHHEAVQDYRIVVVFALLFGISMSVYENNMRAEVANLLQHYEVLAYSATSFAKTVAAGISLVAATIILDKGDSDGGRFALEVELIVSSFLGMLGFIAALAIDRSGSNQEGEEELEEKLLRESERFSMTIDDQSLYSHSSSRLYANDLSKSHNHNVHFTRNHSHNSAFLPPRNSRNVHLMTRHSYNSAFMNGNSTKVNDRLRNASGIGTDISTDDSNTISGRESSVYDDEFFVPDYF